MADNHNGGNAFPNSFSSDYSTEITGGMTLRDYFAAKAMQAIINNGWMASCGNEEIACSAYSIAEAMLEQRNA